MLSYTQWLIDLPAPNAEAFYRFGRQLRALVIWVAIFFGAAVATAWFYATEILQFLLEPVEGQLSPFPGGPPVFTEPTGMFFVTIDLAFRSGLSVAIPLFLIGLYNITPYLPSLRRKGLALYVVAVLSLYAAGLVFVYYIVLPRGMMFLLNYGTDLAVPVITINSYFGLLKQLFLIVPLVFELPLLMWLLARAKVLNYRKMKKVRKFVPLALAIFTAIITPTVDYYNFFIMYIPMLLLFEAGMFLMWTVNPEQGDYLFIRKIRNCIAGVLSKIRDVVLSPIRAIRWIYRKVTPWR